MSTDFLVDDGVFIPMLNDAARNQFYKQALDRAAAGQVVCDIGAGTGFLSVLAIEAGASHVIAVERNPDRFAYLNQTIKNLGLENRIETHCVDFLNSNIHADIYVSETINTQIFGEDMVRLSNHVAHRGGQFIPAGVRIWAEVYVDHAVFVLDLTHNESYEFDPGIDIDSEFVKGVNSDFQQQYNLQETVFTANQLNRLFPMLDRFTDLKLNKIGETTPITVDFNQHNNENNIEIVIPNSQVPRGMPMVVLKWEMFYQDIVLRNDKCWFGNVAKNIRDQFRTGNDIVFRYDPAIRNWRLSY
jgi:protein-L-isoaspartate O-methyltransferase